MISDTETQQDTIAVLTLHVPQYACGSFSEDDLEVKSIAVQEEPDMISVQIEMVTGGDRAAILRLPWPVAAQLAEGIVDALERSEVNERRN